MTALHAALVRVLRTAQRDCFQYLHQETGKAASRKSIPCVIKPCVPGPGERRVSRLTACNQRAYELATAITTRMHMRALPHTQVTHFSTRSKILQIHSATTR